MAYDRKCCLPQESLQLVFDTIPVPAFVVNEDVQIQGCNAAAGHFLGRSPRLLRQERSGEAFHCVNAEASGCGRSPACGECVIRNSVNLAVKGGQTRRKTHKVQVFEDGQVKMVELLVSATPLPDSEHSRILLILEDISELLALRGLLPICAQCKKVRDDRQYWHSIESYLHKHTNMKLTHGLCPTCFAEQVKAIKEFNAKTAANREPALSQ